MPKTHQHRDFIQNILCVSMYFSLILLSVHLRKFVYAMNVNHSDANLKLDCSLIQFKSKYPDDKFNIDTISAVRIHIQNILNWFTVQDFNFKLYLVSYLVQYSTLTTKKFV